MVGLVLGAASWQHSFSMIQGRLRVGEAVTNEAGCCGTAWPANQRVGRPPLTAAGSCAACTGSERESSAAGHAAFPPVVATGSSLAAVLRRRQLGGLQLLTGLPDGVRLGVMHDAASLCHLVCPSHPFQACCCHRDSLQAIRAPIASFCVRYDSLGPCVNHPQLELASEAWPHSSTTI
jgi:hypothetical protein